MLMFQKRVNSKFEVMFETGVNELSWDDTVSNQILAEESITNKLHIILVCLMRDVFFCRRIIVWEVPTSGQD